MKYTFYLLLILLTIIIISFIILNKFNEIKKDRINLIHAAILCLSIIPDDKNKNRDEMTSISNIKDGKNHYNVELYTKEILSISEIEIIKDILKYLGEHQKMQSFVGTSIKIGKVNIIFKKQKITDW
jgi:hypothetical protein